MTSQLSIRARLLRLSAAVAIGVAVGLAVVGGYGWTWLDRTILSTLPEDLSSYRDWRPQTTVEVFAVDGRKVDSFYVERRYWVELGDLPDHVWQAFLAAEDSRFFEHPGVDFFGILRAARSNFQSGGNVQGGSTITQQLVKNLLVGKERSYERKIKEAVLAYRLERELSKYEVLQLYLNFVYLGNGNYGVEAAARDYFDCSAAELDPSQAATIAGLVPAPSRYSPRKDPELARWRRAYVLRRMVEDGYIDPIDAIDYLDAPVSVPPPVVVDRGNATAYVTMVRREIRRLLGNELPYAEGIQVRTPYDDELQAVAVDAIRKSVEAHRDRQGPKAIVHRLDKEAAAAWTGEALADGACGTALVPADRDLEALRVGEEVLTLVKEDRNLPVFVDGLVPPRPLSSQVKGNEVLTVCREGDALRVDRKPWAEGAAVVVENATGRISALVGGTSVGLEGFVRATQAKRQPGSSFKPYVYAAALARGRSQLDTVPDAPIFLPAGGGKTWSPKNYSGGYSGPTALRRAIAQSLNTVAVRLALEVGPSEIARMAKAMGVKTPVRTDVTIALGSSEVTPLDQAMGYSTIARLGVPVDPVWVDGLLDVHGREIGVRGGDIRVDGQVVATLPGAPLPPVLDPGVAYELLDMMGEVVRAGTARKAFTKDQERAGKTGTTNDFLDAWFVGMTPSHTIAVWIGTDGTATLGDKETGGKTALPAWIEIVGALPKGPARFPVPDEAVLVPWQGDWIGLARGHVPKNVLPVPEQGPAPLPHLR